MKRNELLKILNQRTINSIKCAGDIKLLKLTTQEVLWIALCNLSKYSCDSFDAAMFHSGIRDVTSEEYDILDGETFTTVEDLFLEP